MGELEELSKIENIAYLAKAKELTAGFSYWWAPQEEWLVVNHTACQMEAIVVGDGVSEILNAIIVHKCGQEIETEDIHWRPEE